MGWGAEEEDKEVINGDGRRLDFGGEHTIQYTDDAVSYTHLTLPTTT